MSKRGEKTPKGVGGCPFSSGQSELSFEEQVKEAAKLHLYRDPDAYDQRLRQFVLTKGRSAHVENIKAEFGIDVDEVVPSLVEVSDEEAQRIKNFSKDISKQQDSKIDVSVDDEELEILNAMKEWDLNREIKAAEAKAADEKEQQDVLNHLQSLIDASP